MKEWIVEKSDAGGRLDKYMKARLKGAPDSFFYKMARKKNLVINDKKCTGKEILKEGDRVRLYVSDDTYEKFSTFSKNESGPENRQFGTYSKAYRSLEGIRILRKEKDLIFLYKPSGILTQKASEKDLSLNDWLLGYLFEEKEITEERYRIFHPSVLNRLDRNTSGIVICGITPAGSRFGSGLLKDRSLHKFYRCMVEGECRLNGDFEGYLYKNNAANKVFFYEKPEEIPESEKKKSAKVSLGIKPLCYKNGKTLLEVILYTGKSHQIRAMLSHFGYPITGDIKYDGKPGDTSSQGQQLCAVRIEFPEIQGDFSYLSKEIISCEAPFARFFEDSV